VPISALNHYNIEELEEALFSALKLIRIYLKPKLNAEKSELIIMRSGATVGDVAMRIHSGLAKGMKYAYITGPSAKFKNQKVGKEHILMDGDIVTLNLK